MNERILELARQASVQTFGHIRNAYFEQKFAELIIEECAQVCKPVLEEPYEDMDEFDKGLAEGMVVATEIIKRHFGVEE